LWLAQQYLRLQAWRVLVCIKIKRTENIVVGVVDAAVAVPPAAEAKINKSFRKM